MEPRTLWGRFADLNEIPRASGKEEAVCAWITGLAREAGLEVESDPVGNVLVRKPATPGMENRKTVILQSHVDMVHQKNNDTDFDFDTEGIRMVVEGDWVKAEGTTLGADNGLGVATMLAVMESTDLPHPPLEFLFTIDEETGMTGALELQQEWLRGDILLNLDTEDDREIGIGCAGGVDLSFRGTYAPIAGTEDHGVVVEVKGGNGSHFGWTSTRDWPTPTSCWFGCSRKWAPESPTPSLPPSMVEDCATQFPGRPRRRCPPAAVRRTGRRISPN